MAAVPIPEPGWGGEFHLGGGGPCSRLLSPGQWGLLLPKLSSHISSVPQEINLTLREPRRPAHPGFLGRPHCKYSITIIYECGRCYYNLLSIYYVNHCTKPYTIIMTTENVCETLHAWRWDMCLPSPLILTHNCGVGAVRSPISHSAPCTAALDPQVTR